MKKMFFLITACILLLILNNQNTLIISQGNTKDLQDESVYNEDSIRLDWSMIKSSYVDSLFNNVEQILINGNAFFENDYLIININIKNYTRDIIKICLAQWFFGSNSEENYIPGSINDMPPISQITIFKKEYFFPTYWVDGVRDYIFKKMPLMGVIYMSDSLTIRVKKKFLKDKNFSKSDNYHVFIHLYYAKNGMLSDYCIKNKLGLISVNGYSKRLIELTIDKNGDGIFDTGMYSNQKLNKHNAEVLNMMFMNEAYGLIDIE